MFPSRVPPRCRGGRRLCLVMLGGRGHAGGHRTTQTQPVPPLKERDGGVGEGTSGHKKTDDSRNSFKNDQLYGNRRPEKITGHIKLHLKQLKSPSPSSPFTQYCISPNCVITRHTTNVNFTYRHTQNRFCSVSR